MADVVYEPGFYTIEGFFCVREGDQITKHNFPIKYNVFFGQDKLFKRSLEILNTLLPAVLYELNIPQFRPHGKPNIQCINNEIIVTYFHSEQGGSETLDYESYGLTHDDEKIKSSQAIKMYNF